MAARPGRHDGHWRRIYCYLAPSTATQFTTRRPHRHRPLQVTRESADRPWYKEIVVTEERVDSVTAIRSLHLGSEDTVPESRVTMRNGEAIVDLRHKQHLQYTLLAFAWLGRGFEANDEGEPARAALIGVAGGSLLHFWRERVPGGSELLVDAVELDGAVLDAARDHLGLSACETPPNGKCTFHVGDGAAFLREAEDEAYDLLVVDLDMGALVSKTDHRKKHDPARDMYRVLSSRGVLVVNEFSEEPVAERLESSLRLVRQLRRFFPEVHQIRTTTHHNVMVVAAVDRKGGTRRGGPRFEGEPHTVWGCRSRQPDGDAPRESASGVRA